MAIPEWQMGDCKILRRALLWLKQTFHPKGGGENDVKILQMLELVLEDEGVKLDDVQALIRFLINFPTVWENHMADLTKLQEDATKLQANVTALLAKAGTDNQAAVDAIDTTLATLNTQIEAFLNPPTAGAAG
jgi:hypothetical protein